jgi:hypothetical protein
MGIKRVQNILGPVEVSVAVKPVGHPALDRLKQRAFAGFGGHSEALDSIYKQISPQRTQRKDHKY